MAPGQQDIFLAPSRFFSGPTDLDTRLGNPSFSRNFAAEKFFCFPRLPQLLRVRSPAYLAACPGAVSRCMGDAFIDALFF
jgi:hypothetical protein